MALSAFERAIRDAANFFRPKTGTLATAKVRVPKPVAQLARRGNRVTRALVNNPMQFVHPQIRPATIKAGLREPLEFVKAPLKSVLLPISYATRTLPYGLRSSTKDREEALRLNMAIAEQQDAARRGERDPLTRKTFKEFADRAQGLTRRAMITEQSLTNPAAFAFKNRMASAGLGAPAPPSIRGEMALETGTSGFRTALAGLGLGGGARAGLPGTAQSIETLRRMAPLSIGIGTSFGTGVSAIGSQIRGDDFDTFLNTMAEGGASSIGSSAASMPRIAGLNQLTQPFFNNIFRGTIKALKDKGISENAIKVTIGAGTNLVEDEVYTLLTEGRFPTMLERGMTIIMGGVAGRYWNDPETGKETVRFKDNSELTYNDKLKRWQDSRGRIASTVSDTLTKIKSTLLKQGDRVIGEMKRTPKNRVGDVEWNDYMSTMKMADADVVSTKAADQPKLPGVEEGKFKVGDGEFQLNKFPEQSQRYIRQSAQRLETDIAEGKGGVKSTDQLVKEASAVDINKLMKSKRTALTDAELVALDAEINARIQAGEEVPDAMITRMFNAKTEAGRALNATKVLADRLIAPKARLTKYINDNPQKFNNPQEVVDGLDRFNADDRLGMIKHIAQNQKYSKADWVTSLWYNNILSNPATHIANTVGNTARTLWHLSTKPARVGVDVVSSKITGNPRTEFMSEWGTEAVGSVTGIRDGVRKGTFAFLNGMRQSDVENLRVPQLPQEGVIGKLTSVSGRALLGMDEFFRSINQNMEISRSAHSQAISEGLEGDALYARIGELVADPTPETLARAEKLGTTLLFQKMSQELFGVNKFRDISLGDFLDVKNTELNDFKPLRFVIPFIQTPLNIAKFGLVETTPLGGGATLAGRKNIPQLELNRRMASSMVGSALFATLATYFTEDRITGRPPRSEKEKAAFYATKQPYSVRIGDQWVPFNRFPEPLASHLFTLAGMWDNYRDKGDVPTAEKVQAAILSGVSTFTDRTFLSGFNDMLNAIDNPAQYGKKFLTNIGVSLAVPFSGFMGATARALDRTVREPSNFLESVKTQVPFLSKTVPAKENVFEEGGEAVRRSPALGEFTGFKPAPVVDNPEAQAQLRTSEINRAKNLIEKGETPGQVSGEEATFLSAELLYSELRKVHRRDRAAKYQELQEEGQITPEIEATLNQIVLMDRQGLKQSDRRLAFYKTDGEKAAKIIERLEDFENRSKRREHYLKLRRAGIITQEIEQEMNKILSER